jgi:4-amino-4-deoxy-L-arabinose transferase-like glycosyltransferase
MMRWKTSLRFFSGGDGHRHGAADAVWTVLVALAATVLQLRTFDRASIPMDEGQLVAVAVRILEGEILYRDVHTGIGPGIYHLAAALFELFGHDLRVTRWAQVAVNSGIALTLFALARRVARAHWAGLAAALFILLTVVGFPVLTMLNYASLALFLALVALLVLQRYLDSGRMVEGLALGGLLALAALTKQNYGFLAILSIGIAIAWNRSRSALADRSLIAAMLPVVAAGSSLALVTTLYFWSHGALGDLVSATIVDLIGAQVEAFDNPIPSIFGSLPRDDPRFVFLYTPPTLFNQMLQGGTIFDLPITPLVRELATRFSYGIPIAALVASPLLLRRGAGRSDPRHANESRSIVVFAALFFLGIFPSAIWSHLAFVLPPILLVMALELDALEELARRRASVPGWAPPIACVALLLVVTMASIRIGSTIRGWFPTPLDLAGARLHVTPGTSALYRGALRFLDDCAGSGEPIFVAPDIPIIYFLSQRPNPTPYDLVIPGNVDGTVIIDELDRARVRCVVYNPRMYPEFPPFPELFPELARYLQDHYRTAQVIPGVGSRWLGLVRRDPDDS